MVNKKIAKRGINQLQRVKTWQLLVLLVLMGFVSATFLRLNNIGMVERRTAVYEADKTGNDSITKSRLYDLQRYISAHMNTNIDKGVFLAATYNRDYKAQLSEVANYTNENGNIFKKAQEICAPQFSYWSQVYVQCTADELAKFPSGKELVSSVNLPMGPYLYTYESPQWSPDFAGWSLVFCVVILIMILMRFIGVVILRIVLRHHYKSI